MKFKSGLLGAAAAAAAVVGGPALADGPSRSLKDAPEPNFGSPPNALGGFYGGIQVGYGWQDIDVDDNMFSSGKSVDTTGGLGGAYFGYDYYFSNGFLLGFETDWNYLSSRRHGISTTTFAMISPEVEAEWSGSVRARLGAMAGSNLLYLTGGVAFARFYASGFDVLGGLEKSSKTAVGWTIGAGVQRKVSSNVSLKLEYLYADYGDVSFRSPVLPDAIKIDSSEHSVRLGIALHH